MGRGIVESGLVRSERYGLEQRTSDPASTSEGEMWIRTDLAPDANQLATLRFDAGASTWDVPIYDVAATTTNVEKVWRVPIGGTTGFVPITKDSPTFPGLKFQHNGAAFGAHDAVTASAIPDSVVYQHDAGTYTTGDPTWADSVGSADMGITGDPQSVALGGGDGVEGDGVNDYGLADTASLPTNQTHGIAVTFSLPAISSEVAFYGVSDSASANNRFTLYSGNLATAGQLEPSYIDSNTNNIQVSTDNSYDDGAVHTLIINKTGNTASDIDIYVDDMSTQVATTIERDQAYDHANYSQTGNLGYFARNSDAAGSMASFAPVTFGVVEFNTEPYTQSERDGFVNRRPEV